MNQKRIASLFLSFFLGILVFYYSCTRDKAQLPVKSPCDGLNTKFAAVIMPIMQVHCALSGCHDGIYAPGNFTAYADIKIPADNRKLHDRMVVQKDMPPAGPLPDSLLQKIDCWVQRGARNN